MTDYQPEVEMEVLVFSMADYTRQEMADAVNDRRGTDLSAGDASDIVNTFEDEVRNGDPVAVTMERLARGFGADFGQGLGLVLAQEYSQG